MADDWITVHDYEPGTELTFEEVYGVYRRAKYLRTVYSPKNDAEWFDVMELTKDTNLGYRSITREQVRRVWKKKKQNITRKERLKERTNV